MVLKPQLQELLSKQYLKRPWESRSKKTDLLLAVVWVSPTTLFLTDGILMIQTQKNMKLNKSFQKEKGFDLKLKDLEGFVCLFENCKINITNDKEFQRPKEGELAQMFRKKDFREEAKRGECNSNGQSKLRNFEKGEMVKRKIGFEMVNRTVIDLEDEDKMKKKIKKVRKRISKKNKKGKKQDNTKKHKKKSQKNPKVNQAINFRLGFDKFSVVSPYGKYFLSGKREMLIDSLSFEKLNFFQRKFKLEEHIKKMNNPENKTLVPVLELGDIIGKMNFEKISKQKEKFNAKEDRTRTSTPDGDTKDFVGSYKVPNKFISKKKKSKEKKRFSRRKP